MVKRKVCRSSYDGKPWRCRCGFTNKPTKHTFFNLPAYKAYKEFSIKPTKPGKLFSADYRKSNAGLQRVVHMGLILRLEGAQREGLSDRYIAADVSTTPKEAFDKICECIVEGVPLVATYLTGKRKGELPYCKVYKSASPSRYEDKKAPQIDHAVVLIGAGMKKGERFLYFMNSWGKRFCPHKNKNGETVKAGIGKLRVTDLTKNVVRLSGPNEAGKGPKK